VLQRVRPLGHQGRRVLRHAVVSLLEAGEAPRLVLQRPVGTLPFARARRHAREAMDELLAGGPARARFLERLLVLPGVHHLDAAVLADAHAGLGRLETDGSSALHTT